jgi:hypothetical protein
MPPLQGRRWCECCEAVVKKREERVFAPKALSMPCTFDAALASADLRPVAANHFEATVVPAQRKVDAQQAVAGLDDLEASCRATSSNTRWLTGRRLIMSALLDHSPPTLTGTDACVFGGCIKVHFHHLQEPGQQKTWRQRHVDFRQRDKRLLQLDDLPRLSCCRTGADNRSSAWEVVGCRGLHIVAPRSLHSPERRIFIPKKEKLAYRRAQ